MPRTVLFQHLIISVILIFSRGIRASPCVRDANILRCSVNGTSTVDISPADHNRTTLTHVIYRSTTTLSLRTSSTNPVVIKPEDESDDHILQIEWMNTTATRVEIEMRLSANQLLLPLFTATSFIIAPASDMSILVKQTIPDAGEFKLFAAANPSIMSLNNYQVIFDNSSSNSGNLTFPYLIRGLRNVSRVFISGNRHSLVATSANMPASISVNQLALNHLRLQDQILYSFNNLNGYAIEDCEYTRTGQFLKSDRTNNVSLIMKNNNPLDKTLPNREAAFSGNLKFQSITLQEPKLNSSCLDAIKGGELGLRTLVLNLGSYSYNDLALWQSNRPYVWFLKIVNLPSLDVFPSKFFNSFDVLHQLVLEGTFKLERPHICVFAGTNVQLNADAPIISLLSPQNPSDWNRCADTYVKAINIRQLADIRCPPDDTREDCGRWCAETAQCTLAREESQCLDKTIGDAKPFFYNTSYLNTFFENRLWLNRPSNVTEEPSSDGGINIGAIIGAICGLLVAVIIFGITIFCIHQYRKKDPRKAASFAFQKKSIPSSDDSAHVSIATSKTSQSSRYALENAFFPTMQPNNEIAPPLYTAPSESARSASAYILPSAPRASRDSVSTHATHVYETVDS